MLDLPLQCLRVIRFPVEGCECDVRVWVCVLALITGGISISSGISGSRGFLPSFPLLLRLGLFGRC